MTNRNPFLGGVAALLLLTASLSDAATFHNVVSLGDSLLDDSGGGRSPVVAEHLAERLGVPLTKFAVSGSTSTALISDGQHTQAAAQFGAGDLAALWVGGNDFFYSIGLQFGISAGNYGAIDTLENNVNTILGTLRGAGMDVVVFNLPNMAQIPFTRTLTFFQFQRNNIAQATIEWNTRLANLAAQHNATVVDVHSLFADLTSDPGNFALRGNTPILGPAYDCQFCVFADSIHPGSFAQGYIANQTFAALNSVFDPQGAMPLASLSAVELAVLANLAPADFTGNNMVDSADLAIWHTSFGKNHLADADGDSISDGSDFLIWQRQFGSGANALAASEVVPEPSDWWLILLGLLLANRTFR